MLPKPYKLTKQDFERIEKEGKLVQFDSFGASLIERNDTEPSRFGFIVSNKICKDAVDRNRIKRAIREAVRQSRWQTKKGASVLFLTKTVITNKSTEEIMREVRAAIESMGLLQ